MKTKGYVLYSKKTMKTKLNGQLFKTVDDAIAYAKANGLRNYNTRRIVTI